MQYKACNIDADITFKTPVLKRILQTFGSGTKTNLHRFRLAALQLEMLSKLRVESKIREAVYILPGTIDAYYDRAFLEIDEGDAEQVLLALKWLAFSARPITLQELAESILVHFEEPYRISEWKIDLWTTEIC